MNTLKVIQNPSLSLLPDQIEAMFRNGAQTFLVRLRWDVVVQDGLERDVFDDANSLYLVSMDPHTDQYLGIFTAFANDRTEHVTRRLPVFAWRGPGYRKRDYLGKLADLRRRRQGSAGGRNGINPALGELLVGIGEVALVAGLTQIVSVFDARIYRVLRAAGCNPQIIGRPQRIGSAMSYAGLFDTDEGPLRAIREAVGIENPALLADASELAPA